MRILIVGAGAVGGTFGAKLAGGGHAVGFVARGENGRMIRERGLLLRAPEGERVARGPVFESVEAARGFEADVALLCVKWGSLSDVARATGATLGDRGVAIPLLNGLEVEQELCRFLPSERVVGGVAQLAAAQIGPGEIELRAGGMITVAPLSPEQAPLVEKLAAAFSECFPCHAESDIARVRWQKLLWNAPFNAVCALTRRRAGEVLALPELEALVKDVMREVIAVARADGVELPDGSIDAMIGVTLGTFARTEPSMLQDVRAGRETETDELQGAVVARGERHGVPTPLLAALHVLLRGLGSEGRHA